MNKITRILAIAMAIAMVFGMTACGHEHEWADANCVSPKSCTSCEETEGEALGHNWADATCASPKTCTVCGETEGEALEHTWVDANYQQPKTCSVCAATEGEALLAYFTEYGLDSYLLDKSGGYDITRPCNLDDAEVTVGKVTVEDYKTIVSDETHEAMDGYEWKVLTFKQHFYDENVNKYGVQFGGYMWGDRYIAETNEEEDDEEKNEDGVVEELFTTGISQSFVWNGAEYNDGSLRIEESLSDWMQDETGAYYIDLFVTVSVRVPVNYDGFIFGLTPTGWTWPEGSYLHEFITDETLMFCFD